MVTSTRASASISSSPAAKRLVTPRTASRVTRELAMMLRAPAQQPVRDRHDEAVGEEAERANDDHAGHDEIGARESAPAHDPRAEAGGNAGHLADHDQDPGKAVCDAQAVEDRGQGGRKYDLPEHGRAGTAEHRRGL